MAYQLQKQKEKMADVKIPNVETPMFQTFAEPEPLYAMDLQDYIYCRFSPPRPDRNYLNSIVDEADWHIHANPEHGLNILGHSNLDNWKTRDHELRKRQETFADAIRTRSSESIPY
jgi:hypothetical protein